MFGIRFPPSTFLSLLNQFGLFLPFEVWQAVPSHRFLDKLPKSFSLNLRSTWKFRQSLYSVIKQRRWIRFIIDLTTDDLIDQRSLSRCARAPCVRLKPLFQHYIMQFLHLLITETNWRILLISCELVQVDLRLPSEGLFIHTFAYEQFKTFHKKSM